MGTEYCSMCGKKAKDFICDRCMRGEMKVFNFIEQVKAKKRAIKIYDKMSPEQKYEYNRSLFR